METKFGQKLTEKELKAYIPNKNLQLTLSSECKRLRKVIEEKDALIAKFKKYDEERKTYYRRFEQNYALMEERFAEVANAIDECGDLDDGTKEFYKCVINRLQDVTCQITTNKDRRKVASSLKKFQKLRDSMDDMKSVISVIGDANIQEELDFVLNRLCMKCDSAIALLSEVVTQFNIGD